MTTFEAPRVEVVENALEPETAEPRRRVKRKTINTIIWFVALLVLVAIVLYPLVWLFFSTFKPSSEFGQNPGLIPENPTFDNYTKVVEGIAGKAAKRDSGGPITTITLRDFLVARVGELANKLGHQQEPQYFRGRDAMDYVLVGAR